MKRKLGPVAFILETTRAHQRMKKAISGLCLEGTPVYHSHNKKGYCVLAGVPQAGGTFNLHLYRHDAGEKEGEVKSLYNITLEQFDHYGYQYAELTSAKPPTLRFSELPVTGRKLNPEGNVVFACIRRKAWSDPQAGFKCCPQEICWMYLDEDTDPDDGMVTVGYPWNSTPRHPSYPCRQLKWSTFVIQYHIFYDFHGLIDGPVSNL